MNEFLVDVEHYAFEPKGEGGYVATVTTGLMAVTPAIDEALELAYMMTNTIHAPWVDNDAVQISAEVKERGGCRSTSMGDILQLRDTDAKVWGRYTVAMFGFDAAFRIQELIMDKLRAKKQVMEKKDNGKKDK